MYKTYRDGKAVCPICGDGFRVNHKDLQMTTAQLIPAESWYDRLQLKDNIWLKDTRNNYKAHIICKKKMMTTLVCPPIGKTENKYLIYFTKEQINEYAQFFYETFTLGEEYDDDNPRWFSGSKYGMKYWKAFLKQYKLRKVDK